jgi:hypothetical protein
MQIRSHAYFLRLAGTWARGIIEGAFADRRDPNVSLLGIDVHSRRAAYDAEARQVHPWSNPHEFFAALAAPVEAIGEFTALCRECRANLNDVVKFQVQSRELAPTWLEHAPEMPRLVNPGELLLDLWDDARRLTHKAPPPLPSLPCGYAEAISALDKLIEWFDAEGRRKNGNEDPNHGAKPAHSIDFRSVNWYGTTYTFSPSQAAVVRVLWENWDAGTPDVGNVTLLDSIDCEAPPDRLDTVFRDHPAWNTMIVGGATKGARRLKRPFD